MADLTPVVTRMVMRVEQSDMCDGHPDVTAVWRYHPADPWAVTVRFADGEGPVEWVFGRELLATGLRKPAGVGDVRIRPCLSMVVITLAGLGGTTVLSVPAEALAAFLRATYWRVPEGAELRRVDVDAALAGLLATGGGAW